MYSTICPYTRYNLISQNSTCCVTPQHVMTRYLAHAFWRMLYSKRDTSVTTSATGAIQYATNTRALLLLRRPPCWNKHGAAGTTQHVTSRHDSHDTSCSSCRDVSRRDATSGIWAILRKGNAKIRRHSDYFNDCLHFYALKLENITSNMKVDVFHKTAKERAKCRI